MQHDVEDLVEPRELAESFDARLTGLDRLAELQPGADAIINAPRCGSRPPASSSDRSARDVPERPAAWLVESDLARRFASRRRKGRRSFERQHGSVRETVKRQLTRGAATRFNDRNADPATSKNCRTTNITRLYGRRFVAVFGAEFENVPDDDHSPTRVAYRPIPSSRLGGSMARPRPSAWSNRSQALAASRWLAAKALRSQTGRLGPRAERSSETSKAVRC